MSKLLGLMCTCAVVICVIGCGGGGETALDNATQDDVAAYEQMIAEEEAAMDADYVEEE